MLRVEGELSRAGQSEPLTGFVFTPCDPEALQGLLQETASSAGERPAGGRVSRRPQ